MMRSFLLLALLLALVSADPDKYAQYFKDRADPDNVGLEISVRLLSYFDILLDTCTTDKVCRAKKYQRSHFSSLTHSLSSLSSLTTYRKKKSLQTWSDVRYSLLKCGTTIKLK